MTGEYISIESDWVSMVRWNGQPISAREALKKTGVQFTAQPGDVDAIDRMKAALISAVTGSQYKQLEHEGRMQVLSAVVNMLEKMGVPTLASLSLFQRLGA